jgi:hypothetical protein
VGEKAKHKKINAGGSIMGGMQAEAVVLDFAPEEVVRWKREISVTRQKLFRGNWKNRRPTPALQSRGEAEAFRFIVEWYDEFGDVTGRNCERNRLDRMLGLGLDVNAEKNIGIIV